ncbi:MAG: beta-hexosaminidase [Aestuariivita sp.]|nr:beta-hexosaminidase [Aestuariivita sp.]
MAQFGATILDAQGTCLNREEKAFFRDVNPFGFILFSRNIDNAEQVRSLCHEFREAVGRDAIIMIDQEGGRIQRLRPPVARNWPPPFDHVLQAGKSAARVMWLRYRLIAEELHALGIDCNCAPTADLANENTHHFLYNRCMGTMPKHVAGICREIANAHFDAGILPIIKHIPGHGRSTNDSHFSLPRISTPLVELENTDFAIFRALNDLPLSMTAHVVFEALDDSPVLHSNRTLDYIRSSIGFSGLILTDDISMKALSGDLQVISKTAIESGCDVVLYCNGTLIDRHRVAEAAGVMSEVAQKKAEATLTMRHNRQTIDSRALETELSLLLDEEFND